MDASGIGQGANKNRISNYTVTVGPCLQTRGHLTQDRSGAKLILGAASNVAPKLILHVFGPHRLECWCVQGSLCNSTSVPNPSLNLAQTSRVSFCTC